MFVLDVDTVIYDTQDKTDRLDLYISLTSVGNHDDTDAIGVQQDLLCFTYTYNTGV